MELMRMYNEIVDLITTTVTKDELFQDIVTEIKTEVFCNVRSIGERAFYSAALTDLRPALKFVMDADDYNEAKKVEYNGVEYRVIRTYITDTNEIELTCERVIADG